MTIQEWVEKFNREAPDPTTPELLMTRHNYIFREDKGVMFYDIIDNTLFVHEMCGDAKFFVERAKDICNIKGLTTILAVSKHSQKAMCRLLGCEYLGHLFKLEV